jgi:hypothetical protein
MLPRNQGVVSVIKVQVDLRSAEVVVKSEPNDHYLKTSFHHASHPQNLRNIEFERLSISFDSESLTVAVRRLVGRNVY